MEVLATRLAPLTAAGRVGSTSVACDRTLPASMRELVRLRASQIDGCGACVDIHTKEAAHVGETAVRLNPVAVRRQATVFTDAERAALELAEAGTRIADTGSGAPEPWCGSFLPQCCRQSR